MQVHIVLSDTDSPIQKNLAQNIMNLVYNRGVPTKLDPADNPAVGSGIPPAPLPVIEPAVVAAPTTAPISSDAPVPHAGHVLTQVPAVPAALIAPAVPSSPANIGTVQLDTSGLPWDERIHAETKALNKAGTWRGKRGADKATVAAIEKQLRQIHGTVAQTPLTAEQMQAQNQWAGVSAETQQAIATGQPVVVSPGEAEAVKAAAAASMAPVPAPPPAAVPPAAPSLDAFTTFIRQVGPLVRTEANPSAPLTADQVQGIVKVFGVNDLVSLREAPHFLDPVRNMINQALATAGHPSQVVV